MRIALRNLLSTPAAVLNRAGLNLHIGLSSEDPMVGRNQSETFETYLSVYTPDGIFADCICLGSVPPHRRQLVSVSDYVRPYGYTEDHLVVVHRVPKRLADRYGTIDEPIELEEDPDYRLYRHYVQYAYPDPAGAHGGVIYEIGPRHNERAREKPSSILTFTPQVVLSETVESSILLLNYSVDPSYSTVARFAFGLHSLDGVPVHTGICPIPPFSARALDVRGLLSHQTELGRQPDSNTLTHFNLFGVCANASLLVLILNLSPSLRAVSIEHTHAPQGYLIPFDAREKYRLKGAATLAWREILDPSSR